MRFLNHFSGQKQRVSLARSVYNDAEMFLLGTDVFRVFSFNVQ
jgi:ABC-type Mn2+/Zn2+ transport system ATPase subunit